MAVGCQFGGGEVQDGHQLLIVSGRGGLDRQPAGERGASAHPTAYRGGRQVGHLDHRDGLALVREVLGQVAVGR
ncbi:hypothetical protein [Micromonospora ureilytica]|uniref:hypothetical protein n=1 Tax=Micromonospora ureilytica TaxID=709868 RepID=UPI0040399A4F